MYPVGAIFVPFPLKTGTHLLHPLPPSIVERIMYCILYYSIDYCFASARARYLGDGRQTKIVPGVCCLVPSYGVKGYS